MQWNLIVSKKYLNFFHKWLFSFTQGRGGRPTNGWGPDISTQFPGGKVIHPAVPLKGKQPVEWLLEGVEGAGLVTQGSVDDKAGGYFWLNGTRQQEIINKQKKTNKKIHRIITRTKHRNNPFIQCTETFIP